MTAAPPWGYSLGYPPTLGYRQMLTEIDIRVAKPKEKPYKLHDERGLYLLVTPTGARSWRFKYRVEGREKLLTLGLYPDVGLKRAREKRDEARKLVADGGDPSVQRLAEKEARRDTFETIAREFLALLGKRGPEPDVGPAAPASPTATEAIGSARSSKRGSKRSSRRRKRGPLDANTLHLMRRRLEMYIFPEIGSRPIKTITAVDLLAALRKIEAHGHCEVAHRVRALCGRVFRYANANANASGRGPVHDMAADLIGALKPVASEHFAAITDPQHIGPLLLAIDHYHGDPITIAAAKILALCFPRSKELRKLEWSHLKLDGDTPEWRVPPEVMKMRDPHIIPLSHQAVTIFRQLREITDRCRYVFSAIRDRSRPISDGTIRIMLRTLGYTTDEMSTHGFRTMASTTLNENGWNGDWIEAQLSHGEDDEVRGAYNFAQYLADRRRMMQWYADHLDQLKAEAVRVPIKQVA